MHKNELFISYAHGDNVPVSPQEKGWVSRFHDTFSNFLGRRLGRAARIWRDQKLQGNDVFGCEIINQLRDTALLVSVISPHYVQSAWCMKEIAVFCSHAQGNGGLVVGSKSRVFKIIAIPIDRERGEENVLPAVLRDSLGYEFYIQSEQGPMELDPDFGESFKKEYLRRVCILANDVDRLLRCFVSNENPQEIPLFSPGGPTAPKRKTVIFLASCSYDLRDKRQWIEADLRGHGYIVLPEQSLPGDEENAHRNALAPLLARADLSIHMIGSGYGAVPEGPSNRSLVEIQNDIAAAFSRSDGLKRLIWLPEGHSSTQPDQVRFVQGLVNKVHPQQGADLLRGSLEKLRTVLHATLDELEETKDKHPNKDPQHLDPRDPSEPGACMIYLLCVQQDRRQAIPLRKWLKSQGFQVCLPAFEGNAATVRETHEGMIRDCLGALIFYGAGDEAWYRSVTIDLRRAPVHRDGRPLPSPLIYLALPSSDDKDDMVEMEQANVVDGRQAFSPELMLPFLLGITGPVS